VDPRGVRRFAEALGACLWILSILSLVASLVVPLIVHRVLAEHGVRDSFTPWVVLLVGIFASLILAAIALILWMLCVIHDRQSASAHTPGVEPGVSSTREGPTS
jgi:hypothetical protein